MKVNEENLRFLADLAYWHGAVWPDPRFPPSPYYRFFRMLAHVVKPKLCVELGVCGGGGSLHFCIGCNTAMVVGVEKDRGTDQQRENWAAIKQRFPNFVLWFMSAWFSSRSLAMGTKPLQAAMVRAVLP